MTQNSRSRAHDTRDTRHTEHTKTAEQSHTARSLARQRQHTPHTRPRGRPAAQQQQQQQRRIAASEYIGSLQVAAPRRHPRPAAEVASTSRTRNSHVAPPSVSAARPAAGRRRELKLLDALDEAVIGEGRGEARLGPGLRLEGRGGARVNLVVHVVQLLIPFRWVGREHADALLALAREGGCDGEQREEGTEELKLKVAPALLLSIVGHAELEQALVVVAHQAALVHTAHLRPHALPDDHGHVGERLAEAGQPEVDEHAAALEVLSEEHILEMRVAVAQREWRPHQLARHRVPPPAYARQQRRQQLAKLGPKLRRAEHVR
eukprot:scaffold364_cov47-Phaeocystis_antarctica.AAC.2